VAALRVRVAELEATAAHQAPVVELTAPARRLRAEMVALRKERDDLAESLAQIEAYQPGILNVAKAWVASIDRTARCRRRQRMAGKELTRETPLAAGRLKVGFGGRPSEIYDSGFAFRQWADQTWRTRQAVSSRRSVMSAGSQA